MRARRPRPPSRVVSLELNISGARPGFPPARHARPAALAWQDVLVDARGRAAALRQHLQHRGSGLPFHQDAYVNGLVDEGSCCFVGECFAFRRVCRRPQLQRAYLLYIRPFGEFYQSFEAGIVPHHPLRLRFNVCVRRRQHVDFSSGTSVHRGDD